MKSWFLSGNGASKATHYLGTMLTYLKSEYLTPLEGPKMYYTDLTMHRVVCIHMHEHKTNYDGTLIPTGRTFCGLMVSQIHSLNIMEELAMQQLVGSLPYKYILFPMQVVMVMR